MLTRNEKLKLNTFSSLIKQIVVVTFGLIIPRLLIMQYGSETNGVINSITQFLGLISLMNLGVGAVVLSSFLNQLQKKIIKNK